MPEEAKQLINREYRFVDTFANGKVSFNDLVHQKRCPVKQL